MKFTYQRNGNSGYMILKDGQIFDWAFGLVDAMNKTDFLNNKNLKSQGQKDDKKDNKGVKND